MDCTTANTAPREQRAAHTTGACRRPVHGYIQHYASKCVRIDAYSAQALCFMAGGALSKHMLMPSVLMYLATALRTASTSSSWPARDSSVLSNATYCLQMASATMSG